MIYTCTAKYEANGQYAKNQIRWQVELGMENDHSGSVDLMDTEGLPYYYIGLIKKSDTHNNYANKNHNQEGSYFLDCISGNIYAAG